MHLNHPQPFRIPRRSSLLAAVIFATGAILGPHASAKDAGKAPPKSSLQGFFQQFAYYPVPFEYSNEEAFLLKGSINGKGITFKVDTGCPITALDPKRTTGLKTLKELHTKISDALLGTIDDPDALLVPTITIAQARFVNQPAIANTLDVDYHQTPWNGLLGLDFLKRNFCVIDCAGAMIYFRGSKPTPEQATAIAETFQRSGYTALPFHGTQRIMVTASISGSPLKWIVDTGASFTVLSETTRTQLKVPYLKADNSESFLPTALEGQSTGLTQSGLGTHQMHMVQIPEFSFADRTWRDVYMTSHEVKFTNKNPAKEDFQGFIGADILVNHGAVIDLSSDTIWLPPEHK